MQVKTLTIQQRGNAGLPAVAANDLVRLQEAQQMVSGCAPLGHHHPTSDIDGLAAFITASIQAGLLNTATVTWMESGTQMAASVVLKPSGGVLSDAQGLYIDSGVVSLRGHTHLAADITDFAAAVSSVLSGATNGFANSATVQWQLSGTQMVASVVLQPAGGLKVASGGLEVDFGTGANQVAAGNHTHALLHNPASAAASSSLTLAVDPTTQVVSAEVKLQPNGGLIMQPSGVAVDFGTGHNQAARGDHTHAGLQGALVVESTTSLALSLDPGTDVLSGVVRLSSTLSPSQGALGVNPDGLYVVLGSGVSQAAPGNHTHSDATESQDGFMSASDKAKLDRLVGLTAVSTSSLQLGIDANENLSGVVRTSASLTANQGALGTNPDGLYVVLGTGANQAAAGNHTHADATETQDGFMSASDKTKLDNLTGPKDGALVVLDGYGNPIPTGFYEHVVMPYSGTVTGWDLIGQPSGTLVVDVYKGAFTAVPLNSSQSVTAGAKPSFTMAFKNQNLAVNWPFALGDVFGFNVDMNSGVQRATLRLRVQR